MAKKKDYDEDIDEEEFNLDDDTGLPEISGDEMPENAMGLAHQINKESETIKAFKDMPRETRFSFLDNEDKAEIKHHARSYRTWKYIEKIIFLRVQEDKKRKLILSNLKKIDDKKILIQYLKDINRDYLISVVEDLTKEELIQIIEFVKKIKPNYMLETIEQKKQKMDLLYNDYKLIDTKPEYIDDMDNLGKVVDTSIISMGYKGNAAQHSVMTINAVKNEDIRKEVEEKTKFSLLDAFKRRLG